MRRHILACSLLTLASLTALAADSPEVDAVLAPETQFTASVTKGTWMDLDVSPNGELIVFSLLGNLYTLPIAGGQATALTGGDKGWYQHPRFSPDGARIAYTSDIGGGDNLWVMDADGNNPRQISTEDFRLVAQPDSVSYTHLTLPTICSV